MNKMDLFSFPNYKMVRRIGEGSFGKVVKAIELDTKREVALKILMKVCVESILIIFV